MKDMEVGKSPGNDGLTVGCLRAIWTTVSPVMIAAFEEALKDGEMATSQKQSVIRLIPKKDKDGKEIKN